MSHRMNIRNYLGYFRNDLGALYRNLKEKGALNLTKSVITRSHQIINLQNNNEIATNNVPHTHHYYDPSIEEFESRGRDILKKQQNEISFEQQKEQILKFDKKPLLSIIIPLYNPEISWLKSAIESIVKQSYPYWEICFADDGSSDLRNKSLIEEYSNKYHIKYVRSKINRGISVASNSALSLTEGEYIILMDQDDLLPEYSLFRIVEKINQEECDLIYSDECKISEDEKTFSGFFFKPDWSPEFLLNYMYIGHITVIKKELIDKIGGFRTEYDFSQDYDLVLRAVQNTEKIVHIEKILYFWRISPDSAAGCGKNFARTTNVAALNDYLKRFELNTVCYERPHANSFRVISEEHSLVSIIIPSDSYNNCVRSIDTIMANTAYTNIEIIIVTNTKIASEIEKKYCYNKLIRCVHYNLVYNFSDKCNVGVDSSKGKYVVMFNDDVIPINVGWIDYLLDVMNLPGVGAASPMLIYENDSIQYAGMVCGVPGQVTTSFNGYFYNSVPPSIITQHHIRDVSVLTGACMMMLKSTFTKIGGFDTINTPTGHSDVDISFKVRLEGLRCVYTPYPKLRHIGTHSWDTTRSKYEVYCLKKWGKFLKNDPYFTESMKQFFFGCNEYKIHLPQKQTNINSNKDVLLISHNLDIGGAPYLLIDVAKILLKNNYYVTIVSKRDGPLRNDFIDIGIPVIIDSVEISGIALFRHFANNYNLIIANTINCKKEVEALNGLPLNIMWWIHEGSTFKSELLELSNKQTNAYILLVSDYIDKLVNSNLSYDHLYCGIKDCCNDRINTNSEKIRILVVAHFLEERKGQDILLKSLDLLTTNYIEKIDVTLIGKPFDDSWDQLIRQYTAKYNFIHHLLPMQRDNILKMVETSDVVIIPSRDETGPITAIEGMIYSKIVVVSSNTGVSKHIINGNNGFVFKNENINELALIIKKIVDMKKEERNIIANNGRMLFENQYSIEVFEKNLMNNVSTYYLDFN